MSVLVDKNTRLIVQGITGAREVFTRSRCWITGRKWWRA